MKKNRRIVYSLVVTSFVVAVFVSLNYQMICYGFEQAKGQWNILSNTVPIELVYEDTRVSEASKFKIRLIQEIKQFAIDSLGLNGEKNYSTFYDQKQQAILWVVTACPRFELVEYKWKYPILGELGYKGFFDKTDATNEAERLRNLGYDADVDEVNAWSTLGWLKDPILSSMLEKDPGELARLIIHELTHTTVYISDDADFNENLATFIGDNGAKRFMLHRYGKGSNEFAQYINYLADVKKMSYHLLAGAESIESLYRSFRSENELEKLEKKRSRINEIINGLDTIHFADPERFLKITRSKDKVNNTLFISFKMYHEQQRELEALFEEEFNSNFKAFISNWK